MAPEEKDFLLAEFKSAWDTVNNIDNRRGAFASYFAVLFVGVFSVLAALVKVGLDRETKIGLTILLVAALAGAFLTFGILLSERKANRNYRHKINLIRDLMIGRTTDARIKEEYLPRTDLGIRLSDHEVKKVGRTLSFIFGVLCFQCAALGAAIVWLWCWAK